MSTPKDALYKQRQREFRDLNKTMYSVPFSKKPSEYHPSLVTIKHKDQYKGDKGR